MHVVSRNVRYKTVYLKAADTDPIVQPEVARESFVRVSGNKPPAPVEPPPAAQPAELRRRTRREAGLRGAPWYFRIAGTIASRGTLPELVAQPLAAWSQHRESHGALTAERVVRAILAAPNLESLRCLHGTIGQLTRDPQIQATLQRAIEVAGAAVAHDTDAILQTALAAHASQGDAVFELFADVARACCAAELEAWTRSIAVAGLPALHAGALTRAIAHRRAELAALADPKGPRTTVFGVRSFEELIDGEARRRALGGKEPIAAELAALPPALRQYIESAAKERRVPRPSASSRRWATNDRDDWFQKSLEFQGAGAKVVWSSRPPDVRNMRLAGPLGHYMAAGAQAAYLAKQWGVDMKDVEAYDAVNRGQAISAHEPPRFLPTPKRRSTILELAMGLVLRDNGAVKSFAARGGGLHLRPDDAERAKPWRLLAELSRRSSLDGRLAFHVSLEDAKSLASTSGEPFDGLYIEAAPDENDVFNRQRELFSGELMNRALHEVQRWAPELLPFLVRGRRCPELPAVERVIAQNRAEQPFAGLSLIAIQHLNEDNVETLLRYRELGLDPTRAHVLGIPYSTSGLDAERLRHAGFGVDTREERALPYDVWREVQVHRLIERALAEANGQKIVVLDDGGHVVKLLREHFPEQAHRFVIAEQTTRGLRVAEENPVTTVIDYAKSQPKKLEMPGIEGEIRLEVDKRMRPFVQGAFLPGRPAVVVGYGWIGQVVASVLEGLGREVEVVDPSAEARALAAQHGRRAHPSPVGVLGRSAIVAGCSGKRSLSEAVLREMRDGQIVFSASSSNVELELSGGTHLHEDLLVQGPGYAYLVLGAGFPINFTGDGRCLFPESLQHTRAGMLSSMIQAARLAKSGNRPEPRVVPLDAQMAAGLLAFARVPESATERVLSREERAKEDRRWLGKRVLERFQKLSRGQALDLPPERLAFIEELLRARFAADVAARTGRPPSELDPTELGIGKPGEEYPILAAFPELVARTRQQLARAESEGRTDPEVDALRRFLSYTLCRWRGRGRGDPAAERSDSESAATADDSTESAASR